MGLAKNPGFSDFPVLFPNSLKEYFGWENSLCKLMPSIVDITISLLYFSYLCIYFFFFLYVRSLLEQKIDLINLCISRTLHCTYHIT